jgi:hypothetical protein
MVLTTVAFSPGDDGADVGQCQDDRGRAVHRNESDDEDDEQDRSGYRAFGIAYFFADGRGAVKAVVCPSHECERAEHAADTEASEHAVTVVVDENLG